MPHYIKILPIPVPRRVRLSSDVGASGSTVLYTYIYTQYSNSNTNPNSIKPTSLGGCDLTAAYNSFCFVGFHDNNLITRLYIIPLCMYVIQNKRKKKKNMTASFSSLYIAIDILLLLQCIVGRLLGHATKLGAKNSIELSFLLFYF